MEPRKQNHYNAHTGSETPSNRQTNNPATPTPRAHRGATRALSRVSTDETPFREEERALTGKISHLLVRLINDNGDSIEPSTIENDVGMTVEEVRSRSPKLDALLNDLLPEEYDYDEIDHADMATVRLLKIWRFEEPAIGVILLKLRSREKIEPSTKRLKMARWCNYLPRTIINTNFTDAEPFDANLMRAFMKDAREHGGRPTVGVDSLREVYHALMLMGKKEVTIRDVVDSDFVVWTTNKRRSQEQRVRRSLDLLVKAEAMDKKKVGRPYVYEDAGLRELSIPPLTIGL